MKFTLGRVESRIREIEVKLKARSITQDKMNSEQIQDEQDLRGELENLQRLHAVAKP